MSLSLADVERAAVARFAARGYAAVGIRELGRALGLNSASLYHYAPSKEQLLVGVMRACLTELLAGGTAAVSGGSDPGDQLSRLTSAHVGMSATNPLTCRVTDQEVRSLTGSNLTEIVDLRDRYERQWDTVLARGARAGRFHLSDRRVARLALLDMCNGIANWYAPTGRTSVAGLQSRYVGLACRIVGMPTPDVVAPIPVQRLDCEPIIEPTVEAP
jgi:AcrR family transcriptional regulator